MRLIGAVIEGLKDALPNYRRLERLENSISRLHEENAALERKLEHISNTSYVTLGTASLGAKNAKASGTISGKIRVAFLIHNFEAWWSLRSIYHTMKNDDLFEPIVFSLPRKFPGSTEFIDEEKVHERLSADGVISIRLNDDDPYRDLDRLRSFGSDAIFRQSQWAPDIPPAFDSLNLSFADQYYVPYEITTISEHGLNFVSSYHHQLCKRIFVASELSKEIAINNDLYRGARMTVTGHPKVQEIINAEASWPIHTGNKTKVIWSAHHAIDTGWNNYGVFPVIYEDMLEYARRRSDMDFLFSPHPALLTRIKDMDGRERDEVDDFFASWEELPNTSVLYDGTYLGPFKASDILIVDGLSFLTEYQLNEKPIVQISRGDRSPPNAFGEMVFSGTHELPVEEIQNIEVLVDGILSGTIAKKRDAQRSLKNLLTRNEDPAQEIVNALKADFMAGEEENPRQRIRRDGAVPIRRYTT